MSPVHISILTHISNGCGGAKTVAYCMGMTESNINHNLRQLRRELGAFDTAHAVAIALREGYIK